MNSSVNPVDENDLNGQQAMVLICENLYKSYHQGPEDVPVIQGVELAVKRGQRIAIVGTSGSGKSTLLNLLGGLDTADQGRVLLTGQDYATLSERKRGELRNRSLGFVYQFHHLLPEFSALENVCMPLLIRGVSLAQAESSARALLKRVGLESRVMHKPAELSGGERQRVAIARALVPQPDCVLLDEPTGNLDAQSAHSIHQLMLELNAELHTSFVVVTHDMELAQSMDQVYHLQGGLLTKAHR
jgi:lipoprotein-releasing system ATP-binding protein